MEEAGIGLVTFIPFSHLEQTSMKDVEHTKFVSYKNHQKTKVKQENEPIPTLASNELLDYY
jgi:hypothetical protein